MLNLPFGKLMTPPSKENPIESVWIEPEMAELGVSYKLKNGQVDSVPLEAFLDFNKDPEFIREMELHRLSLLALKAVKKSGISKNELCRMMNTSMSQLLRLLDPTNYSKSLDQMVKLFTLLGHEVKIDVPDVA